LRSKKLEEEVKLSKFVVELNNVEKSVEQLRREFRFFREPLQNKVALESGCKDSSALKMGLARANCRPKPWEGTEWLAEKAPA
jgi:hypothetical protein